MDVVRRAAQRVGILGSESEEREAARRRSISVKPFKPRTGPLPSVPWRDLSRRGGIEQHLPALLLLAFGLLAMIQFFLRG